MIRFIVETIIKKRDANGNRYFTAVVTSTRSSRQLVILDTTASNGHTIVHRAIQTSGEIFDVQCELPAKEYDAKIRRLKNRGNAGYEHQITAKDILDLEQPE